jgi:hypothetical protein
LEIPREERPGGFAEVYSNTEHVVGYYAFAGNYKRFRRKGNS